VYEKGIHQKLKLSFVGMRKDNKTQEIASPREQVVLMQVSLAA
jgi:hypothetical protein